MGLFYKNQDKIKALLDKTGVSGTQNRLSDLQGMLFGGRGGDYDELAYLRGVNTDAVAVNAKKSDALVKFTGGQGIGGNRADQMEREFLKEKSYP